MTEAQSSQGGAAQGLTGPPLSKTEYVLQRLREDIASGVVVPGTSLRQSEIAARYGVSATPVREALRLLEAGGSISYAPHRGATVRELSPERVRDVYLLRADNISANDGVRPNEARHYRVLRQIAALPLHCHDVPHLRVGGLELVDS